MMERNMNFVNGRKQASLGEFTTVHNLSKFRIFSVIN
jgi:hypothetical protein